MTEAQAQEMIQVQILMPDGPSLRYVGIPEMINTYGVWSLQLTTPSGQVFTWNVDRVRSATHTNSLDRNVATYHWPNGKVA